jgi:hypothetical protein
VTERGRERSEERIEMLRGKKRRGELRELGGIVSQERRGRGGGREGGREGVPARRRRLIDGRLERRIYIYIYILYKAD